MITNSNYEETYAMLVAGGLYPVFEESHQVLMEVVGAGGWNAVDSDPGMTGFKKEYFSKLGEVLKKRQKKGDDRANANDCPPPDKPTPKKRTATKPKSKSPKAPPKPKSEPKPKPQKATPEFARDRDIALRLIGRFVAMQGKVRSYSQVLALHTAINRAVTKGQIRKTFNPTPHHEEVMYVQEKVAWLLNNGFRRLTEKKEIQFDKAKVEELRRLTKGFAVYPSTQLAVRFIGMEGKTPDDAKAQSLLDAIEKATKAGKIEEDDPNHKLMPKLRKALKEYIDGDAKVVRIHEATLAGLRGNLAGCGCQLKKNGLNGVESIWDEGYGGWDSDSEESGGETSWDYIPPPRGERQSYRSDNLPRTDSDVLPFSGRWAELFNQPTRGFSAIIFGMPKNGKSTLAADLGGYLAQGFGRVLYASIEEGVRGTFTERLRRLGVTSNRMDVKNHLPADLSPYDFVIVDSASRGHMDVAQMRRVLQDWPGISFIFLTHTTKAGMPRGSNELLHEVDVLVQVRDGVATATGRFGPGEMDVRFE